MFLNRYASELQSSSLPLLVRTQNARSATGTFREKWVPNPSSTSSTHLEMFSFLGKLMGIAIRSKQYMNINLSQIVWKKLVNDTPNMDDIKAMDIQLVTATIVSTAKLAETLSAEEFDEIGLPFIAHSADLREVPLYPGSETAIITKDTCQRYIDLLVDYRLHEFDAQIDAIRHGLGTIVPLGSLR
jgi:hypothetical protein